MTPQAIEIIEEF